MKVFLSCLLGLLLLHCGTTELTSSSAVAPPDTGPNVVFVLADDLGYGDLGSYGQELIATPVLDSLARTGMRFTQHYSGSTVCAPSRSVLMTGRHTGHTFVRGNGGDDGLPDSIVTLAEVMQSAGYDTRMVGKWGLGTEGSSGEPTRQGFDDYYGYLDQVYAHNYYPEFLIRNGEREYLDNEVNYLDSTHWHGGRGSRTTVKNTYSHDLFMDDVTSFLRGRGGQTEPFFLYLPFTIPHDNGEEVWDQRYEIPSQGDYADRDWENYERGYAAMISRLDGDVGQIVHLLDSLGLRENTLLVFTSDNGPLAHENLRRFDSNGPLRGYKRDLYEGGIRIPLIVNWPGRVAAGTTSDHVSGFQDWLPTLAEVGGVGEVPPGDGISLLPTLTGTGDQAAHDYLYWEFMEQGGKVAVREGDYKAVNADYFSNPEAAWELYDLAADLDESDDLAARQPEVLKRLRRHAAESHIPSQQFPFPDEVNK